VNTVFMRCTTICSHAFTEASSLSSGSGVVRRNHGFAGLVMPLIMPAESVPIAKVAVESMIFWFRRCPRLVSVTMKRGRIGRILSARSRHDGTKEERTVSIVARCWSHT
jgi:hypothetical protein